MRNITLKINFLFVLAIIVTLMGQLLESVAAPGVGQIMITNPAPGAVVPFGQSTMVKWVTPPVVGQPAVVLTCNGLNFTNLIGVANLAQGWVRYSPNTADFPQLGLGRMSATVRLGDGLVDRATSGVFTLVREWPGVVMSTVSQCGTGLVAVIGKTNSPIYAGTLQISNKLPDVVRMTKVPLTLVAGPHLLSNITEVSLWKQVAGSVDWVQVSSTPVQSYRPSEFRRPFTHYMVGQDVLEVSQLLNLFFAATGIADRVPEFGRADIQLLAGLDRFKSLLGIEEMEYGEQTLASLNSTKATMYDSSSGAVPLNLLVKYSRQLNGYSAEVLQVRIKMRNTVEGVLRVTTTDAQDYFLDAHRPADGPSAQAIRIASERSLEPGTWVHGQRPLEISISATNSIQIDWLGDIGFNGVLQESIDLVNWTTVTNSVRTDCSGRIQWTVPVLILDGRPRFYRVYQP